jgi:hypothetical protein
MDCWIKMLVSSKMYIYWKKYFKIYLKIIFLKKKKDENHLYLVMEYLQGGGKLNIYFIW